LYSDGAVLSLAEHNGAVEFMRGADGVPRVVAAEEAFTLQLLDGKGNPTRLKSSDFVFEGCSRAERVDRVEKEGVVGDVNDYKSSRNLSTFQPFNFSTFQLAWRHANGLVVRMSVTATGGEFRFKPSVENIPAGMLLEWFDGPQVFIRSNTRIYWSYMDGCEVYDHAVRLGTPWEYRPVGFTPRYRTIGALYPGWAQMQFLASYANGFGLYFAASDPHHTPKAIEFTPVDGLRTRLSLQTFCGDLTDGAWRPDWEYVLRPYSGGWMEACALYRDWVRTLPEFKPKPKRPAWMADSPVTLICPVRGQGVDHGDMSPNRYFPYVNIVDDVRKYGELLDSKILVLLAHWEGTAPWSPPYVWPPYGGEEKLAELRDALHRRGDLLGLYCSGTAWTQKNFFTGYSREAEFEREGLARHMIRGPRGEIEATVCNSPTFRFGCDLCLTEDWSRKTVEDEVAAMAKFGVDYCQFFDQNIGGAFLPCYSRSHRHPPIPGAWQTAAMVSLQKRLCESVSSAGSKMILGCEACAATPYVPYLFYNDAREFRGYLFGRSVPGISFVFHEWMCNFSGNGCMSVGLDPRCALAQSFHYGDMVTAVLGGEGRLLGKWGTPWSEDRTEQEPFVKLLRNLNAVRRKHGDIFLDGRMVVQPYAVETKPVANDVDTKYYGIRHIETSEVIVSFWENDAGKRLGFATNWKTEPSEIVIVRGDGSRETRAVPPCETIELEGK
ncbi:MAG: hypothetical protein IJI35_12395, partial [Kiritimatiellae bacterium]|nr:hypothetical protein [Kiritimatiellia bacterium]